MNSTTLIIGLVLALACSLPFVLSAYNRKNKEKRIVTQLNDLARNKGLTISQYDMIADKIIGIDEISRTLFFIDSAEESRVNYILNLSQIKTCKINNSTRSSHSGGKDATFIDKLELVFSSIAVKEPETRIELYNSEINGQIGDELAFVNKWQKIISEKVKAS